MNNNILITGICGFTGSTLARELIKTHNVHGIDNFIREGSRQNFTPLKKLGINILEGDIRNDRDLAKIPKVDWIIDCAAEPSVLAGTEGRMNSFDLMDHNLIGTIKLLELCKQIQCGFTLISTSRVYSVSQLSKLSLELDNNKYIFKENNIRGITTSGINEDFSTAPPLSLYGSSKRCAEILSLEYGNAYNFPVWINRCGVLSGRGQFGKADQGIFSFWIKSWRDNKELKYIGFNGKGAQVRDCLHPKDLIPILHKQMKQSETKGLFQVCNFGGGVQNSCSLYEVSQWCKSRFGDKAIISDFTPRKYDLPWIILDCERASSQWDWRPTTQLDDIFAEIADDYS